MKTKQLVTHLAAAAFCCALGSSALSAATTTPVGAVSVEMPSGISLVSIPFQNAIEYQGSVDSVSGTSVGLSNVPTLDGSYYIQVMDGTAAGKVVSIISASSSSIVLESEVTGLTSGDVVAIREHSTVSSIFPDGSLPNNTLLTTYNSDGSSSELSYFDGFGWFEGSTPRDGFIIFPGEGFALSLPEAATVTFVGSVSSDPVVVELGGAGFSLVGSLNPAQDVTLEDLFGSDLPDSATLVKYSNSGGSLVEDISLTYFDGFGWFEGSTQVTGSTVGTNQAVVVTPGSNSSVSIPAAYVE